MKMIVVFFKDIINDKYLVTRVTIAIIWASLYFLPSLVNAQTNGFTVPSGHPRLWWNAERLQKAKDYHKNVKPFTFYYISTDTYELALMYVLTGNVTYAQQAINSFMTAIQTFPSGSDMRWYGENLMITYDWCYDVMTPAQRATLMDKWNQYIEYYNNDSWGNVNMDMEENNYYQGYMRNSIEWGVVSYNENAQAQHFLDHGLITRWNPYLVWAQGRGKGGFLQRALSMVAIR